MQKTLIVFIGFLVFFLVISLACGGSGFFLFSSSSSSSTPYQNLPAPTLPNPFFVPDVVYDYHQLDCSDAPTPEGINIQLCYWIDVPSNSFAALYYSDITLKAIATYVSTNASSKVVKQAAYFSADVSYAVGWDSSDTSECAAMLEYMNDDDTYTCGDYKSQLIYHQTTPIWLSFLLKMSNVHHPLWS